MTRVRIGFGSPVPLLGLVLANACSLEFIAESSRNSLAISSVTPAPPWRRVTEDLQVVYGVADCQPLLVLSIGSEQVDASTLISKHLCSLMVPGAPRPAPIHNGG